MAILTKDTTKKPTIDLTSSEGNAYFLLGTAMNLMKQLDFTPEEADGVYKEMKSGDYEHLIKTFDYYFGDFIDLER